MPTKKNTYLALLGNRIVEVERATGKQKEDLEKILDNRSKGIVSFNLYLRIRT